MTLSLDDLAAILSSPGSLLQLRNSVRTTAERETIRRCAALHEFDRELYERVVATGVADAPLFEDLIAWREVEVASPDGRYRIRERQRELEGWSGEEQQMFRHAVADWLRDATAEWRRDERLQHLLALNDPEWATLLDEIVKEADARFDLARFQAVVDLALEHRSRVDDEGQKLIDANRALLRARRLWKDEYYKSLVYLSRKHVDTFLEELLATNGAWIGNLFAGGGLGKTAGIRALISGTCVPRRIPVAHIDFFFTRHDSRPTALLLKIVQQFEEQVPGTPFVSLFNSLSETESIKTGPQPWTDSHVAVYFNQFASTLREERGDQPSLLIFDNMEDMLLARADVLGMMKTMEAAHIEYGGLRVLFSGRYSLFEPGRVPGVEAFRGVTIDRRIERFDKTEAHDYLVERRGVPDSKGLEKIIKTADGVPFKLSLFGDILLDNPDVSIDELVATGDVDLTYLIVRIVRRLEVRLQWILRYGVVPRRLTKKFFRKVMARFLPAADTPPSALDEPLKGLPTPLQKDIFTAPKMQLEIDRLWEQLLRYAAEHSWISTGKGETDTLSVHEEVRRPMRRLLRQNDIFRALHHEAVEHFKSENNARETVYHLFHLGDPTAPEYWRRALDEAIAADRVDDVLGLADAVLTDDFFEDGKAVLDEHRKEIVPADLLAAALIAQAFALVRKGRESGRDDRAWDDALNAGQNAAIGGERVEDTIAIINATVAINDEEFARAADRLQTVDKRGLTVEVLRGIAYAFLGEPSSSIEALEIAERLAFTPGVFRDEPLHLLAWPPGEIERILVMTLVDQYVLMGRYDDAYRALLHAMKRSQKLRVEFALRLAGLQLELHQPAAALSTLESVGRRGDSLRAEAELMRYASLEALEICKTAVQEANIEDWGLRARLMQVRGRIHAGMMEISEARAHYERAHSAWREAAQRDWRDRRGPVQCLVAHALTELEEFSKHDRAQKLVDQVDRVVDTRDKAAEFMVAMLRARLDSNFDNLPAPVTARQRVEAAIARHDVPALRDALSAISPPHARLACLSTLRQCGGLPPDQADDVLALLPPPAAIMNKATSHRDDRGRHRDDRGRAALDLVEPYRVFGRTREAQKLLSWGYKRLAHQGRPLLDRARHAIEKRLGVTRKEERRAIKRWRAALATEHPDFLSVLLFEEAQLLKADDARADLVHEALQSPMSLEARAWITEMSIRAAPVETRPVDEAHRPQELVIRVDHPQPGRPGPFLTIYPPSGAPPLHLGSQFGLEQLGGDIFMRRGEIISYGAVKVLAGDPSSAARMMRKIIVGGNIESLLDSTSVDLRLELPDSTWQAYPWELAFDEEWSHRPGLRSVYRARRQPGDVVLPREPMRVLIVRRSVQTELFLQRGLQHIGPSRTDDAYRRLTADVHVLEDPVAEELFDALHRIQPELIHISASPGESPSLGGAILELASRDLEVAAMAPQSFPVGLFVEGVASTSRAPAGPVLIIDGTTPRGETETWRQLLLRNVFAAELFNSGKFSAVLATGLFRDPMMAPDVYSHLTKSLAEGSGYGELATEIRRFGSHNNDAAASAVAFFCNEADMERWR